MNDWFYIDDLQQQTQIFASFSEVKEIFSDGWFFVVFLTLNKIWKIYIAFSILTSITM